MCFQGYIVILEQRQKKNYFALAICVLIYYQVVFPKANLKSLRDMRLSYLNLNIVLKRQHLFWHNTFNMLHVLHFFLSRWILLSRHIHFNVFSYYCYIIFIILILTLILT